MSISREHFRLHSDSGGILLTDLGSMNGLHVGGERVLEARVDVDEWFVAGTVMFVIREGISWMTDNGANQARGAFVTDVQRGDKPASTQARTLEPPGEREGRERPFGRRKLPHPGTGDAAIDAAADMQTVRQAPAAERALDSLAEALSVTWSANEGVAGLAFLACHWGGGAGACVVSRYGNGWSLESCVGEVLADEDIVALVHPPGGRADERFRCAAGSVALRISGATWLVVKTHAGNSEIERLRLLAELGRWAAGWVENSPDTAPVDDSSESSGTADSATPRAVHRRAGAAAAALEIAPFIGVSAARTAILAEVERFAAVDLPVLVTGESGSGKELIARLLHAHSPRANGPFVAINCAALPSELLEAELFGIEKNVATGVSSRAGHFRQAHGGTLFLDEIADLPASLQPKLLRALECGAVTPLGAPLPVPVDVRIVAATNAAVDGASGLPESGRLRSDLFYRLAGAILHIPPLRARTEDILPLARHFAREAARRQGCGVRGIDLGAARLLLGYRWPGNVRELRHAMYRAVALADGSLLHAALLPPAIRNDSDAGLGGVLLPAPAGPGKTSDAGGGANSGAGRPKNTVANAGAGVSTMSDYFSSRDAFDRHYFTALLERSGGNLSEAARLAGMSRSHLYTRLAELGLK